MYVPMSFQISVSGIEMTYGPPAIPNPNSDLTHTQKQSIVRKFKVTARVLHKEDWGIWAGSTCRRQCRHAEHEVYHVYSTRYVRNRRGL